MQIVHVAELCPLNRRLMIDPVLGQHAKVVIEGAILLHHVNNVVQVGDSSGTHGNRGGGLDLIVVLIGGRRDIGGSHGRMDHVGSHVYRGARVAHHLIALVTMVTETAFVVVHDKVEAPPDCTVCGEADKVTVMAPVTVMFTCGESACPPTGPRITRTADNFPTRRPGCVREVPG